MSLEPEAHEIDLDQVSGSSQYFSRKDLKVIGIAGVIFAALSWPIYTYLREESFASQCGRNMKDMAQAMLLYANENDSRFCPAYVRQADGSIYMENGDPYTWASIIRPYMKPRQSNRCPTAEPQEAIITAHPDGKEHQMALTYGLYLPTELRSVEELSALNTPPVMLAETVTGGRLDTYDPRPFLAGRDGFLIGFDTGDDTELETVESAKYVTRLAFPGAGTAVKTGDWTKARTRHRKFTSAVLVNGAAHKMTPGDMQIARDQQGRIGGLWGYLDRVSGR